LVLSSSVRRALAVADRRVSVFFLPVAMRSIATFRIDLLVFVLSLLSLAIARHAVSDRLIIVRFEDLGVRGS
jgi:hypothetical protein